MNFNIPSKTHLNDLLVQYGRAIADPGQILLTTYRRRNLRGLPLSSAAIPARSNVNYSRGPTLSSSPLSPPRTTPGTSSASKRSPHANPFRIYLADKSAPAASSSTTAKPGTCCRKNEFMPGRSDRNRGGCESRLAAAAF
jgi:hypothetical protein